MMDSGDDETPLCIVAAVNRGDIISLIRFAEQLLSDSWRGVALIGNDNEGCSVTSFQLEGILTNIFK